MKLLSQWIAIAALACAFTSCRFEEPVFTDGFAKVDAGLGGVWVSEEDKDDPRKLEFAVCAPLDAIRVIIHHPTAEKGGVYYEGRQLVVRGRSILQLRILATFSDGIPKPDAAERYTLLWIEPMDGGKKLRVRALGGDGVKDKGPAEVRKLLEDPAGDWSTAFGEPGVFRRLEDK